MKKASVIIPVLNCEKYLSQCIESVLSSTLDDVEVIVVDDGSIDRSVSIAQSYEEVILVSQGHSGCGGARNAGLEVAQGEYIYFLDADDYISPTLLENLYRVAKTDDLDGLLFNMMPIYETPEIERRFATSYDTHYRLIERNKVLGGRDMFSQLMETNEYRSYVQRQFWRRTFLIENNCVFPKLISHEDECFAMCAILSCRRIECIDEDGVFRRYRKGSETVSGIPLISYYNYFIAYCVLARLALERFSDIPEAKILPIRLFLTTISSKEEFESFPKEGSFPDDDYLDSYAGYLLYKEIIAGDETIDPVLLDRIRKAGTVYLYGAGYWAGRIHRLLAARDIAIERVIVTNAKGNPSALHGTKIIEAKEALLSIDKGSSIIIVCMMGGYEELEAELNADGFDVIWCGNLVDGEVLV